MIIVEAIQVVYRDKTTTIVEIIQAVQVDQRIKTRVIIQVVQVGLKVKTLEIIQVVQEVELYKTKHTLKRQEVNTTYQNQITQIQLQNGTMMTLQRVLEEVLILITDLTSSHDINQVLFIGLKRLYQPLPMQ